MKTNKKPLPLYKDPKQPVEVRVEDLLRRMTVQEKADQLLQETIGRDANPNNLGPDNPFHPTVGSILSYPGGSKARNEYQRAAVEKTRLGIPIIWGYDVIHGWRTGFPSSISQAATFRPELTRALSRVSAEECYADGGVNWTFSPMVEVCHDPRWGRVMEGYGEDPHTAREFTEAAVIGYQGKGPADWKKPGRVAACLKHFVGYSASEAGRDYSYTDISGRALWEWYLQPFEAGVAAGARTLMSSFNDITGVPAVCNRYTLDQVLRRMWGFDGFVVSDWGGVSQLKDQSWSADPERQTVECLEAGNEMDMVDGVFKCIPKLIKEGKLSRKTLDEAVRRVLRVKFEIGLFEHPYTPEKPVEETCYKPESLDLALQAARECMTLLKNDGAALPVKPKKGMRVAVIGPAAESRRCHLGAWRAMIPTDAAHSPTLLEKIKEFFPGAKIDYEKGCGLGEFTRVPGPSAEHPENETEYKEAMYADAGGIARAAALAAKADVVLLCVGEEDWMTGEYTSRADLRLPNRQEELAAAVRKAAKGKVVSFVVSGRPLALAPLLEASDAVLYMWQAGCRAAEAAMEVATGRVNPSGKLPMTFPRDVGQVPVYYNEHTRSRVWANDYLRHANGPQFPFGFGLSYTTFEYGAVKVSRRKGGFTATVTVKNTGRRAGQETVFWYVTDPEATYTQPRRRVIAFEKIALAPGEEKKVRLAIDPMRDLAYVVHTGEKILEPGAFKISASGRSEAEFTLEVK